MSLSIARTISLSISHVCVDSISVRSIGRSIVLSIVTSIARSIAISTVRSIVRSVKGPIVRSIVRSKKKAIVRSTQIHTGVD